MSAERLPRSERLPRAEPDAVLLIAFGGPERPDEIRPFLQHVLRGRPVPASRIEEVAHHYEAIGGRSPINELTEQQRAALERELARVGQALPVRVGMRHARPFVADTLRELAQSGARRILGVVMAALHDSATLQRYAAAVDDALRELQVPGLTVEYVSGPETHPGYIAANVAQIEAAYARLPEAEREHATLVFTAHSVPTAVGEASGYVQLFESAAALISAELGRASHRLAYQSRSGSPQEAWLEPQIGAVIREEHARGARALVVAPIGFVCDHVEVLYDLDVEAAEIARGLGVEWSRASTVGTHPAYIEALADTVLAQV